MRRFEMIKIEPLARHQNLIPTVAKWHLSVFAKPETTLEKCENALRNRLNTDSLNSCFLAFVENEIVGTVSLTANDIPTNPLLSPCVTQLFVSEKYRHKHIGQSLVEFAEQKLKDMNFKKAYLYTTNETIHT
ncbi:MAG: GNAT family N-acetyltransferase [Alphaproteobacteria bacterium]|nr:GNAT family N-acetyltransferase [Alphaproteobacteria bacterium]